RSSIEKRGWPALTRSPATTAMRVTTPPRSVARAITSLAGSMIPDPATSSPYGLVGAAMGGEVTTRGRYFEATDQPPNPSMARARSGCGGHLAQLVVDGGSQGGNQAKAINLSRGRHRL